MVPAISWPLAIAVGAVVAPPDAVAATAIARRIGLPRRIVTILEGESLLNDATALVTLRTALAASSVGVEALDVGLDFLWASVGGAALGFVVFVVVAKVRLLVTDPLMDTAISLVTPFAAYLLAEELHSSGVISVVVTGLLLGHKAPVIQTAQSRIAERINWRTIAFLLENTVFLLIGLQARWILEGVADSELSPRLITAVCAAALLTTVVLRMVWVFAARYLLVRPGPDPDSGQVPPWQYTLRPRLGRHARRGDAGGGLRHPRGDRAPRGAAAHRLHRRGRHPLPPGPLPAVGGPHPAGALARPAGRRAGPGVGAAAGLQGRLQGARADGDRRPARRPRPDPAARRAAQLRRLGAAVHDRRAGVAQRPLRAGPAWP